jgi:hypothetical protein
MSDQYDGQLPDSATSPELAETARRLATDAALWSARLPSAERLAQHARETPYTFARQRASDAAHVTTQHNESDRQPTRGYDSMPASRIRAFIAVAAAFVIVALLAVLFSTLGKGHGPSATIVGSGGPPNTPSGPGVTYATALPTQSSPYSNYVTNIVTANNVDSHDNPVGVTSQFYPGEGIFVVAQVRNPPPGDHVVMAYWFINGSPVSLNATQVAEQTVTRSANIYFMTPIFTPGQGQVRILWDPPANDTATDASDPHLIATLNFTVLTSAQTSAQTPTPAPTPTPGPIMTPTPSPSA